MDAVVIGGAGFVGSHLVDRLLADGHTVDVVDNLSTGVLTNLAEARANAAGRLRISTIDATHESLRDLVALRRPNVVYHLAALVPGADPVAGATSTLASTLAVLDAARALDTPKVVMLLPAVSLYGEVPIREQPAKEGRGWSPADVRGVVARTVADLLQVYRDTAAVEFTALVAPVVYGRRQRPTGGVVAAFADAAAHGEAPLITGDGRQSRELLYIDDTVDALTRAAERADGLVVNLGTGRSTPVRELWQMIAGEPPTGARFVARPTGDVLRLALAATRARLHLGWTAWTTPEAGLADMAAGGGTPDSHRPG